jgi:hypothetical protein
MLTHPAAQAGSSPTARWSSPELRHEVEDGTDGRDPPVSVRVRGGGSARDPLGLSTRAGVGRSQAGRAVAWLFLFLFIANA